MAPGEIVLRTFGLKKYFGAVHAVEQVDLAVERGQVYGFLGPNGAGKSTTIKMLTGLLAPSAGQARVLGHDLAREPLAVKSAVGVVPDGLSLFERLSGAEQLRIHGQLYGLPRRTAARRAEELLDALELAQDGGKLVQDYSHGMKKKLALGCALIHGPKLLFLDEPFEGIDAVASRQIKDLLHAFVGRGGTIFLTSHILEIVERLSTHIGVIAEGRLVAQGRIDEVRAGAHGTGTLEELFIQLVGGDRPTAELDWL